MATDPNPQDWTFAEYEAPRLTVSMSPAEDITGQNFKLNVRDRDDAVVHTSVTFTVTSMTAGVFYFALTSAQTGATIGVGDFLYDVWRIDAGFEKRLVWGMMHVQQGQWQ